MSEVIRRILSLGFAFIIIVLVGGLYLENQSIQADSDYYQRVMNKYIEKYHIAYDDVQLCEADLREVTEDRDYYQELSYTIRCDCTWDCHYPSFMEIAEEIAGATEYEADVYDCTEFSEDLVKALEDEGWVAETRWGYVNDSAHQWSVVEVPIEATSGQVINPYYYNKLYVEEN